MYIKLSSNIPNLQSWFAYKYAYQSSLLPDDTAIVQRDCLTELLPLHVTDRLVHILALALVVRVALLSAQAASLRVHPTALVHHVHVRTAGGLRVVHVAVAVTTAKHLAAIAVGKTSSILSFCFTVSIAYSVSISKSVRISKRVSISLGIS